MSDTYNRMREAIEASGVQASGAVDNLLHSLADEIDKVASSFDFMSSPEFTEEARRLFGFKATDESVYRNEKEFDAFAEAFGFKARDRDPDRRMTYFAVDGATLVRSMKEFEEKYGMKRPRPGISIHTVDPFGTPAVSTGLWIIHPDESHKLGKHIVGLTEPDEDGKYEIVTRPFVEDAFGVCNHWAVCDELIDDDVEPVTITDGIDIWAYRPTIQGMITDESHWVGMKIDIPEEWQ